jgi:hypothetical protein
MDTFKEYRQGVSAIERALGFWQLALDTLRGAADFMSGQFRQRKVWGRRVEFILGG